MNNNDAPPSGGAGSDTVDIQEFELISSVTEIALPLGAQVLHADRRGTRLMVWVLGDFEDVPEEEKRIRRFIILGADKPVPDTELLYISTAVVGTTFVWHVFEEVM